MFQGLLRNQAAPRAGAVAAEAPLRYLPPAETAHGVDARALAEALRRGIEGEVRFDPGSRALYATDASNYRQVPIGVVLPRSVEDVVRTVEACRRHGAPLLSRGGGTSLCGQCCNVAVVMDFSKYMNRVLEIDAGGRWARVQPGVVLDELREQANRVGLTFAPDPATHNHNTLGGMIGNNSCGPHSVMGGETVHNVIELDVLTYDGLRLRLGGTDEAAFEAAVARGGREAQIYQGLKELAIRHADEIRKHFPKIPRRVSGYNLPALLPENGFNLAQAVVGSEGSCVVVLEARLRLLPNPEKRALLVLGYEDIYAAADDVPCVMEAGPIALEGVDDRLADDIRRVQLRPENLELLPEGRGWLLVEFGGDTCEQARERAEALMGRLRERDKPPSMALHTRDKAQERVWKVRESGLGATAHVPDKALTWEGWEDSSVPPERLGEYLRELRALLQRHGYEGDFYGHFGQGCLHTRTNFDLFTADGIRRYRRFIHEAADLVVRMGGSISGEHGDGQSKAELLPRMFGEPLMQAFRDFKALWDPEGRMNPGKVVDAWRADENLRLGPDWHPAEPATHFAWPDDGGRFSHAMLRCVGVGECRKKSGTMCPSYMATGEEMHSTRGRARLLFEMLGGDPLKGGWQESAVKEALDLCLSCKGCKGECPVKVDMATYKAEFLSHYHERHARPLAAHLFGRIDRWARLGAHAPGLVNALLAQPALAALGRRVAGIAPQRELPRLAPRTFRQWFAHRPRRERQAPAGELLLWPDTFNQHFHPEVARAATEVLEAAGWRVRLPPDGLCCGRPLYEFGLLDRARDYLATVLDALGPELDAGTPIVMLEPACASVFREELPALFPRDARAKALCRQAQLLCSVLRPRLDALPIEPLDRPALHHPHCHHKAVFGLDDDAAVLDALGLDVRRPDAGCCGMAGSFGFEREKYEVSMRCGERVLLPAVRAAGFDTILLTDGYSCREQIRQATGRTALHPAQVLRRALRA
ncbi:FAD-binding and (Fe-S)-binding domain-containing protein [Caldimonas tepidiphila]|uniref:FAD-binding and (Fe-S)-binding domain-containing protein n=1 Tax=Caldimonas tepidiphila TaxID=2315841 RepID=UPI000E5B4AF8|nr:FAD-binding and (Fe-S)-binding domain-containing protein [Caldimonas tepidiphila]